VSEETLLGRLKAIKASANGMLAIEVYRKLFDIGLNSDGGTYVEVGTAHGAATVALALGGIESQRPFHIYTVDPFSGKYSSRTKCGGVHENIAFVNAQFEKFGVSKCITVVAGCSQDLVDLHVISDIKILILDADGRIDRDLAVLIERMSSDCKIIIDDIDDVVYTSSIKGGVLVDQKHRISHLLTERLLAEGVLRQEGVLHNTAFFTAGDKRATREEIFRIALPAYRELVFAETGELAGSYSPPSLTKRAMIWTANNVPLASNVYNKSQDIMYRAKGLLQSKVELAFLPRIISKPRVCILADRPGWAYDTCAHQIKRHLARRFDVTVRYNGDVSFSAEDYDLLHVCSFADESYVPLGFNRERVIKEISSHRWEDDPRYGPCTPDDLVHRYLSNCDTVVCTSRRLANKVASVFPRTFHAPNGVDVDRFRLGRRPRDSRLVFGWAGNAADPVKGFQDIVEPACGTRFKLLAATGGMSHRDMEEFYRKVDVLVVSSRNEGTPLPLLEAMASGCFPVCVDVGVVPEIVEHKRNGYIVPERTLEAFQAAFDWCEHNSDKVRIAGLANADLMVRERNWSICAPFFGRVYQDTIDRANRPLFRNDDVSSDTSLENFRRFCAVFHKYGLTQIHGVTLRGYTNVVHLHGGTEVEYEGVNSIAKLENATIRRLSEGKCIEERTDLLEWLNASPDEVALHGLYHTDYSVMSAEEQDRDMAEGLALMHRLFPAKRIRFFIAPFNRTNAATYKVAAQHGLTVLAEDGVQLEEQLQRLKVRPREWYRYHHHRFYPDSKFSFYKLSIQGLDEALGRNFYKKSKNDDALTGGPTIAVGSTVVAR
jgi:glycosyltransferase involved in cell wall biosynthesis